MMSRHYKNQSAAAKRTATHLAEMAGDCQDIEAKGILLAASRIAAQIAKQRKTQATDAKAHEDAYVAAMAKLVPEAMAQIKEDWPITTTIQKLAIFALETSPSAIKHTLDLILDPPFWSKVSASNRLDAMVTESITNVARSIACQAFSRKTTVSTAIVEFAKRVEAMGKQQDVIHYALLVDAKIADEQREAA